MEPEKQHIRCKAIIEVLGKPREHVESTIRKYTEKIGSDQELIILKKEFADSKEQGDLWSTFVELEMVVKGIPKLIGFCFDYMPSSIDILKPEELQITSKNLADLMNDLQARLHGLDMMVKKTDNENTFLKRNMNNIVKNLILVSLTKAALDKEKLSKVTGIKEAELEIFLKELAEEGVIKETEGKYTLSQNGKIKTQD